jgi:DNA-directed RNA polymerase specialized sigma24 family protein
LAPGAHIVARQHGSEGPRRERRDEDAPGTAELVPFDGEDAGVNDPAPEADKADAADLVATEDRAAFVAVEQREQGAVLAFVRRFHPVVLGVARRLGIPPAQRDEFTADVLSDIAQRLALGDVRPESARRRSPRRTTVVSSPRAYLAGCARRRYAEEHRQRALARGHEEELAREGRPHHDGAVAAMCSEAALRESEGPLWEYSAPTPAIQRLAVALRAALADEQEGMLDMLSYGASYREIGTTLGTTLGTRHDERRADNDADDNADNRADNRADADDDAAERAASAAKQRVYRLRKRLAQVALAYAADPTRCTDEDYPHVRRLLRRSGLLDGGGVAHLHLLRCGAAANPSVPPQRGGRDRTRPAPKRSPKHPNNPEGKRDDA